MGTTRGLDAMRNKYQVEAFGVCPNVQCHNQPVVPVGTSDILRFDQVKVFCPKCQQIYNVSPEPGLEELDGAYFGTTFAHLFFLTHQHLTPPSPPTPYIPRVFGYRIQKMRQQQPQQAAVNSQKQIKIMQTEI